MRRRYDDTNLYIIGGLAATRHGHHTPAPVPIGQSMRGPTVRDHAWNILERFAKVSKYARDNIGTF